MNSLCKVLFCVSLSFCLFQGASSELLEISDGLIEGTVMLNRYGHLFRAFRRIPYAEPPIGALRFLAPVPKVPWDGVVIATNYGPMCMQDDRWGGALPIDEDCLYLNVFTKNLPVTINTELKPVIAFLHGGGFELGSTREYEPEYLMERDIVLVTIQYRLGAFGFLAVGTESVPGNAGFKDQTLALNWIKNNIRSFGGDPNRVTLAGLSAGSHAATAHMVSPISQGLFINVIAVSGALPWQRKLRHEHIDTARELAARVQCPTEPDNIENMIRCLTDRPATEIAINMIFSHYNCPIMTWRPVIEPDFGQERFLTEQPETMYREGNFARVNVMVGITADEFVSPIADILESSNLTTHFNENFDEIAPACFAFEANDYKSAAEIAQILRQSYLPFDKIDIRSFDNLAKLLGDGVIGYGVHKFVHYVSPIVDVFYYKFSYIGRWSLFLHPRDKPYGAHHVDDIQYVFGASFMGSTIRFTDPENIAVERMTRIWEQFAWTGNPNNATDEFLHEMNWPKHDAANEFYLDIGTHLVEKHGLFLERYAIWNGLESSSFMLKANVLIIAALLLLLFK